MKKLFTFLFIFSISTVLTQAQEAPDASKVVKPIEIPRSALSGVGLRKIDLKDEPTKIFHQRNLYWGKELGVFVVGTQTWNNKIEKYSFDEFVYMYQGEALVKPKVGSSQVFYSGDYFFAPRGFAGEWEIRAGDFLHYELSVITTSRADSTLVEENPQHQLFSRSTLSGNQIHLDENGQYEEVLKKGTELTIKLLGEAPTERAIDVMKHERIYHILSGQVTLLDSEGNEYQCYTGEYFILPQGFSGRWKSVGHQVVKYMTIEKSIWE